jgi:hypothetical protein
MAAVRCKNEGGELQDLLEQNPELLAGEQINPVDPRRWLLIKREMDVPDPQTGSSRWSVDFLFGDQDAVLTLVECKRNADTRSRREVIGQVLDYAANAHRLWTADRLRTEAAKTAVSNGRTLADVVAQLGPGVINSSGDYFDRAIENLKRNEVRIVLFLESAPVELKSLVEFLNRDLSTVEVLIVEAKLYEADGVRVVAPTLWGYTEEIRFKKENLAASLQRRIWDEKTFFAEMRTRLADDGKVALLHDFYRSLPATGCAVTWGSGRAVGTLNIRLKERTDPAMISVTTEGDLMLNFGSLKESNDQQLLRDKLARVVSAEMGLKLPENHESRYPSYEFAEWVPRSDKLVTALAALPR